MLMRKRPIVAGDITLYSGNCLECNREELLYQNSIYDYPHFKCCGYSFLMDLEELGDMNGIVLIMEET